MYRCTVAIPIHSYSCLGLKECPETERVANSLWLITNSKPCSKCNSPIQKNEGCNHIKCTKVPEIYTCFNCFDNSNPTNYKVSTLATLIFSNAFYCSVNMNFVGFVWSRGKNITLPLVDILGW